MTKTDRHLLALISAVLAGALVLLNAVAFRKAGFFADTADLVQQIIPNLIASLIVFLAIYYFIERHIEERLVAVNYLAQLTSTGKEYSDHIDRSVEAINRLRTELVAHKESIKADIQETLEAFRTAQSREAKAEIDAKLRALYSRLADAELRVASLDEKTAVAAASQKDQRIAELTAEIGRLNQVILANRTVAKSIADSAKKI
ncbi:hypothetical protein [Ideonella paludis]|uniref:DNA repair protein n=1 Tax=Ideonella paludis TaxID=1233411 RepID=A0ABS5DXP2_9BURK|nr:hypothetical protein [Ideonella paludis]MBQ0935923.1 hypothetical protein [Ideonella paludis]